MGLALLASTRVLVVWSRNALLSDYVRAELLIATESGKSLGAYMTPGAPTFPLKGVPVVDDHESLRSLLKAW